MTKTLVGNIGSYTFDASAQTITLSGLPTLTIEQVLLVTNVKDNANEVIYQFDLPTKSGTISGNVITLVFDTTSMADTDPLQIWVDLPSSSSGAINSKIEGDVSGNIAEVDTDKRVLVNTKPSTDNAAVSAFGIPLNSNLRVFKEFRYSEASITTDLDSTIVGSGVVQLADNSSLELRSGAATSSSAEVKSKKIHKYVSGIGNRGQWSIILGDTGVAGNIREWGYKAADNQDGAFFRLDGTTLYFVLLNGGTETTVASSAWDIPPTLNANGNLWYINYEWQGVGNFFLYYQQKLVHTYQFQGTSTKASMENPDLPFHFKNQNTTNNTDVILKNPCSVMMYEGNEAVQLKDQNDNVLIFTEDQRIRTQAFGTSLMSENFNDNVFDTVAKWNETIAGSASKSLTNSILSLVVTTGATDSITESYATALQETVGAIAQFNIKYSFGSTLITNNVREWGYLDSAGNDGVFLRLSGSTFDIVFKKNGVETTENIDSVLPDSNFHLYTIAQNGLDDISIFIDDVKIYQSAATPLVGNKEKAPYLRNYNSAALGGTPSNTQVSWINLLDSSGRSTVIVGKDDNGIPREAAFDQSGNLKTVAVVTAPPDTDEIAQTAKGNMSGTQDTLYTITSGKTLTFQRVSGGAETSNSGHIIELYEDPNGNLSVLNFIEDIYANGNSDQKDLNNEFDGDGTRRILLRRRAFGGGTNEVTGVWQGFEQ